MTLQPRYGLGCLLNMSNVFLFFCGALDTFEPLLDMAMGIPTRRLLGFGQILNLQVENRPTSGKSVHGSFCACRKLLHAHSREIHFTPVGRCWLSRHSKGFVYPIQWKSRMELGAQAEAVSTAKDESADLDEKKTKNAQPDGGRWTSGGFCSHGEKPQKEPFKQPWSRLLSECFEEGCCVSGDGRVRALAFFWSNWPTHWFSGLPLLQHLRPGRGPRFGFVQISNVEDFTGPWPAESCECP